MEFGLAREFMLPLGSSQVGPLVPLLAALGRVESGEIAVCQVLAVPTAAPWASHALRSVTTSSGEPFFADAPEVTKFAREKCAEPLYAALVRAAACGERRTVEDLLLSVGGALGGRGESGQNELTPLVADDLDALIDDILDRTTHRSGMILSLSDLVTLIDLPDASIRSNRLVRPSGRTKAAPTLRSASGVVIGVNEHEGAVQEIRLSTEERLRHCYMIGASGTGKSTLLLSMAVQDAVAGNGFAVLDPHGDLIEEIVARIPEERINDVFLFDPADEEFPAGFNILSAHSELERTLLASDLVAVFRRLSTSFGDQMVTVLANAILAFLESDEGGTLLDLRRFLVEKSFRTKFLKTVRDREVVSYWQHEYPLLRGNPQAPLLTRLNTFLRPKLIRHMVAQKNDRFDMRALMDGKKIVLAKLSQGAIGEENSHLLGSLLVAKIAQAAMSRQNKIESTRVPFFLYIDEFHHFITPSVAAILSGARKYALGLTLAHQDIRQLRSRSEDVASAVLANAMTRIVFRVSDQDARSLSDGFSFFEARDLQNLGVGEAIARVERSESDFNLRTQLVTNIEDMVAVGRRKAVQSASRSTYATQRANVEQLLHVARDLSAGEPAINATPKVGQSRYASVPPVIEASLAADFHDEPSERVATPRERAKRSERSPEVALPVAGSMPGRGGPEHKYLQSLIKRFAEDRGFTVSVEKRVLDGHGHVDVALERDDVSVACEITVSTRLDHEINNLTKCLAAGFDHAVLVCLDSTAVTAAREAIRGLAGHNVQCFTPTDFPEFLDSLEQKSQLRTPSPSTSRSKVKEDVSSRGRQTQRRVGTDGQVLAEDSRHVLIARDAAEYLGIAQQTLAKLRWAGTSPPYFKIGRQVVYKRVELDAWLDTRRRRSTSDTGKSD